ncbi:MAG TPA: ribosome biogenesis GTPase YlqF [Ruminococcaceae bacterium]|nr:ribosome biogenesis GTPase YlqF [Oscillospiraceae bacterium]
MQEVQWFPGHMAKTRRMIKENLSLVDCVAELVDARIPQSSRNPEMDDLCANKPRILVMTKIDLADPAATFGWIEKFRADGLFPTALDCKSGAGMKNFAPLLRTILHDKKAHDLKRGMNKALRVLVVGIPNVGKSTFINRLAGAKRAKTENRPGVTRGKQWVATREEFELLDTPGVLWPKFEDPAVGEKLAFAGAIKDTVLDMEELAANLLGILAPHYGAPLISRFKIKNLQAEKYSLLEQAARGRGFLISGGEADTQRAANVILEEYRSGKLGRISLEWAEDTDGLAL